MRNQTHPGTAVEIGPWPCAALRVLVSQRRHAPGRLVRRHGAEKDDSGPTVIGGAVDRNSGAMLRPLRGGSGGSGVLGTRSEFRLGERSSGRAEPSAARPGRGQSKIGDEGRAGLPLEVSGCSCESAEFWHRAPQGVAADAQRGVQRAPHHGEDSAGIRTVSASGDDPRPSGCGASITQVGVYTRVISLDSSLHQMCDTDMHMVSDSRTGECQAQKLKDLPFQ